MSLSSFVDTALDRSIALGYGRLGLLARRRLGGWAADPPRMDGTVVLVTGAASGLGLASAAGFAQLGATVYALARNEQRAADAVRGALAEAPGADVRPASCDLADLGAIRGFAEGFAAREPRLGVLVNNAGVMPEERSRSADGHELMFATHVLAPLALTTLLAPLLGQGDTPGRVINVSSGGMYAQALGVGDWESEHASYSPKKLYARTKREEVVITELLASRLDRRGIAVHAMHPGWADTEGLRRWMPLFRKLTGPIIRDGQEGADTIVWLGAAPEAVATTGLFWHDRRVRPTYYRFGPAPASAEDRAALWRYCESAVAAARIKLL